MSPKEAAARVVDEDDDPVWRALADAPQSDELESEEGRAAYERARANPTGFIDGAIVSAELAARRPADD